MTERMSYESRRIDDRLHKICAKGLTAADDELEAIRRELLSLVHHKIERLKKRAGRILLKGPEPERKKIA